MNNLRQNMMNANTIANTTANTRALTPPSATPTPVRRCGICRQTGHDRRGCPTRRAPAPAPPAAPAAPAAPSAGGSGHAQPSDQRSNITWLHTTVDDRMKREVQHAVSKLMDKWKEYDKPERDRSIHPQETIQGKRVLHTAQVLANARNDLKDQNTKRSKAIHTLEVAMEDLTKQNFKDIAGSMVGDYNKQMDVYKSNEMILRLSKEILEHTCRQWFMGIHEWDKEAQGGALKKALVSITEQPKHSGVCIEADDCPICMEPLGQTGKTVLSCGHTLCTSCFLKQIVVASDRGKVDACACPICRHPYAGDKPPACPPPPAAGVTP